jgi:VIT1/CCC1 family predicted Fe2+/Mn2+ transporter
MAVASALSIIALFGVGYLKCRFTHRNPVKSGIETLAIGVFASIAAYAAGAFVSSIIPGA